MRSIATMFLTHLSCTACGLRHEWSKAQNLCIACQKPLFAAYDLAAAGRVLTREALANREKSLWRYREVLPLPLNIAPISLGEGGTPLLPAARFGAEIGLSNLWVKDEAQNPTQSFKARGMAVAVSMAKYLGATKLAVPTAGNAGGALAAYAARAGLEAHIFMPNDTPRANVIECRELGAARHADRWLDHRLRRRDRPAQREGGMVRYVDAERAVSRRRQKDARL